MMNDTSLPPLEIRTVKIKRHMLETNALHCIDQSIPDDKAHLWYTAVTTGT